MSGPIKKLYGHGRLGRVAYAADIRPKSQNRTGSCRANEPTVSPLLTSDARGPLRCQILT